MENCKGKAVPQDTYGGAGWERRYRCYSFTTSTLGGDEWSASRPAALYPREKAPPPHTHCTGGWVGPEPVWIQRLEEKFFASVGYRTWIARLSSPQPDTILTEPTPTPDGKYCSKVYKYMAYNKFRSMSR
jgi:hypothetical protein